MDETDDPFKDEACWYKANPSLAYGLPGIKYLREQVTQARGMPAKESIVRRLNFCQWVEADAPWISADVWMGAHDKHFDSGLLLGRACYAGLDLSSTQDLTALVLLFEPDADDPYWRLVPHFWLPGDNLHDKAAKDRVPYIAWRDAGYLEAIPGAAVDKLAVIHRLAKISAMYELKEVGYDRWRIEDFKMLLQKEGVDLPLVPFGQGTVSMAPAIDEFERLLLGKSLRHNGNPVMTWCAANAVVVQDDAANRKLSKSRSNGRIDGVVAAVMAAGRAFAGAEITGPSFWEEQAA
jgi:phage terminase large subunit-like protein